MRRYVIAGSGAAGVAALEAIRQNDPHGEITLVGDEPEGHYSRPGLAYYLTGEVPDRQLYPFQEADFRRLNVRRVRARVTAIDAARHRVSIQNGTLSTLPYDRLLLATGARAARIKQPGAALMGVVKLDNFADARQIISLARKARSAVVVGGGITALEIVEGLRARGVRVHYLLRGDRYWSNVLDETESHIVEARLREEGVHIHYNTELSEILGKKGRVNAVLTSDGRRIDCQMVGAAIGIQPRLQLAISANLKTAKGILVDEHLGSSEPDIFSAGDVAQVFDPLTGQAVIDSLWGPACQQGHAAGLNMAGVSAVYRKDTAFNVTRLAGLTTTLIGVVGRGSDADLAGIARGDSETFRQLPDAIAAQSNFKVNRVRILVGRSTLLGAVVMGDQTLSQPLQHLVSQQVDISPVREHLLDPAGRLGDLVVEFYTHWKKEHAARHA